MKDIDQLLEDWQVQEVDTLYLTVQYSRETAILMGGWYEVSNNEGTVAYFAEETDALRFRLNEINRELNG